MRFKTFRAVRKERNQKLKTSHVWFAWYPVEIKDEWVWLEKVIRSAELYSWGEVISFNYERIEK